MSSDPPSGSLSPEPELHRGEVLLQALELRLPGAREHADATASYAFAAAVQLGLDREACLLVREAARLHEVGKLYVRAELLTRPAAGHSAGEREELAAHAAAGYKLALGAGVTERACELILQSGERFDGGDDATHPAGSEIPLGSRIVAAACEYDLLLREHGDGGRRLALIALIEEAGGKLDPMVVDAVARVVERAAGSVGPGTSA
jgi:HD-GYP domain-containing protein (c-di-GMP phosphodiesterase class II)